MNNETEQIFLVNTSANQVPSPVHQKSDAIPGATLVNLENVQDFSTVCRTCATITEFVIPIFEGEGLQNNLAEKIHKHLPIHVLEDDSLPRVVCYQCASTLLAWHELVKCCVQADQALKARLAQMQAPATGLMESEWESSKPEGNKSPPPSYVDSCSNVSPETLKTCPYCNADLPDSTYKDHLVDAHSELLFHCQECDTYVDRKDFILHMSLHCVQYTKANQEAETKKVIQKTEVKRAKKRKKLESKDENENTKAAKRKYEVVSKETKQESKIDEIEVENDSTANNIIDNAGNSAEENDFSDHSDVEYGFGPLPESVFDAIEDSQDNSTDELSRSDSQPSENNDTQPVEDSYTEHIENDTTPVEDSDTQHIDNNDNRPIEEKETPVQDEQNGKIVCHKKSRTCPICSKTYTASSSYFYHMKHTHKQSKEHECDVCGRKFGTRGILAQHAALHTGEKRFECNKCGKKFNSKASLYIHSQIHLSVKKGFQCGDCGRMFRWRTALERHSARHSGSRAHTCFCGRAFNVRADLLRHARTHARGEHRCSRCNATFAQPRYLRVHMINKHSESKDKLESENDQSEIPT